MRGARVPGGHLALVLLASALVGLTAWLGAASQQWPRGAIGVAYGLVVWSFLLEIIAAIVNSNHWLRDTSPMLHIAPVPAAEPDWIAALWLIALGLLAAVAGVLAFGRRDLVGT
jgi:putative exporter of polyketide antibiotics